MESDSGFVVWLTGLPGSGKTTIATRLSDILTQLGKKVEILDGDEVRQWLSPEAGFSKEGRERHLKRVAHIAQLLVRNGVCVIASFVSPYRSSRDYARQLVKDFVEVFVDCPLDICSRRDPKGLYQKASLGEIINLTGPQDIYEPPSQPEVTVQTGQETPEESTKKILHKLVNLGYITPDAAESIVKRNGETLDDNVKILANLVELGYVDSNVPSKES